MQVERRYQRYCFWGTCPCAFGIHQHAGRSMCPLWSMFIWCCILGFSISLNCIFNLILRPVRENTCCWDVAVARESFVCWMCFRHTNLICMPSLKRLILELILHICHTVIDSGTFCHTFKLLVKVKKLGAHVVRLKRSGNTEFFESFVRDCLPSGNWKCWILSQLLWWSIMSKHGPACGAKKKIILVSCAIIASFMQKAREEGRQQTRSLIPPLMENLRVSDLGSTLALSRLWSLQDNPWA